MQVYVARILKEMFDHAEIGNIYGQCGTGIFGYKSPAELDSAKLVIFKEGDRLCSYAGGHLCFSAAIPGS